MAAPRDGGAVLTVCPVSPKEVHVRGPPSEEEGGPQGRSEMVTWIGFPENPWWLCHVISRKATPVSPP